jgi:hypothetical protein
MEFDWEGARRKDLAKKKKEDKMLRRMAGKGSAVDLLFRLRSQVGRIETVNWDTKSERQKQLALEELEMLRTKLLAMRPGFAGGDVDRKAQAAGAKIRDMLNSAK